MNWTIIWIDLFGTTSLLGINMGFWVAMAAVCLVVILMNAVFWGMNPKKPEDGGHTITASDPHSRKRK